MNNKIRSTEGFITLNDGPIILCGGSTKSKKLIWLIGGNGTAWEIVLTGGHLRIE